jgi:hypothetical protein
MKFLSLLLTLVTVSAFAQRPPAYIEEEAQNVAYQLRTEGRYLSASQRDQIARHLESIKRIMNGAGHEEPGTNGEYTCTSRDNDGRAPYVFAVRQGIQVVRISGETFTTQDECRRTLDSIRQISGRALFCSSRDNDGRSPFQMAVISGTQIARIQRTVVSTRQDCETLVRSLQPRRGSVLFCTSRDNDGRSPYVAVDLNLYSMQLQVGSESFSTLQGCEQFLNN